VLRHHWPDVPLYGDVAELDGTQFRGVTMVTGGSPCQDLSIAGKRKGMTEGSGTRSSLFFEQVRIWNESEAPYILWENVYGAFSSNAGRDFAAVLSAIVGGAVFVPADGWVRAGVVAGPTGVAAWRVLDAQYFGVPQRRRRVFVLGVRGGGVDPAEVLSLAESLSGHLAASGEAREGIATDAGEGASVTRTGFSTTGSVGYVHDVMPTLPHKTGLGCAGAQMVGVLESPNVLALDIYNQSISPNGVAHTIRAMNTGEGIPHTLTVEAIPLQNPTIVGKAQNGLGIGQSGDPMYSLESVGHGVFTYDARGNGQGVGDNTLAGDHQNRVTDYTAIVLRNREGKPGGGKGPLLSAERSLTLGTANDQVVFTKQQFGRFEERPSVASTLGARDHAAQHTDVALGSVGIPRRLTPLECERLMGWPDQHTAHGITETGKPYQLSDTARYKLCGNGIASPVTAWIGLQLRHYLTSV
jgi:DNA (cytosine-5)-methyltransferase 1